MDMIQAEEAEGEPRIDAGFLFMAGSDLENAEGLLRFHPAPDEQVKFGQFDSSGDEEEEEKEDGWVERDSFPEFPPGEVPDFLAGGRKVRGSGGPMVPLYKHRSWSANDSYREEAWLRRKEGSTESTRRRLSLTDEDVDELRGCIDLGFRFDAKEDRSLSDTIPALDLYYAVNRQYADCVSRSPTSDSSGSSAGSPQSFFGPGDSPQLVKARLRQWAQVVACAVRNSR